MPNVVVYLPADEARALEAAGEDPKLWVRRMVKLALAHFHKVRAS